MTEGQVSAELEAVISVRLRGSEGTELATEAIIDTGFSDFLTLPPAVIDSLALPRRDIAQIRLADGSVRQAEIYHCRILWNGRWRIIPVQMSDNDPLLGMALLHENLVSLEVVAGGSVTIEPVE